MEEKIQKPQRPKGVPIGTIIAWAGTLGLLNTTTKEWLICDGTKIPRNRFPKLCDILSDNWGPISGHKNDEYSLPDLRGMFLRGVNQDRNDEYGDPDLNKRMKYDNTAYEGVGSVQKDDFFEHNHPHPPNGLFGVDGPGGLKRGGDKVSVADSTGIRGGKETRPKNAYVYYIIKAK